VHTAASKIVVDHQNVSQKISDFMHWNIRAMGVPVACGNQLRSNTPTVWELLSLQKKNSAEEAQCSKAAAEVATTSEDLSSAVWLKRECSAVEKITTTCKSTVEHSSVLHLDRPGFLSQKLTSHKLLKPVSLFSRSAGLATRRARNVRRAF
jgi:hypothetical protein